MAKIATGEYESSLEAENFTDSDKYTLDNLDLLNLPVEFAKHGSPRIRISKRRKQCRRAKGPSSIKSGGVNAQSPPHCAKSDSSFYKSNPNITTGDTTDDKSLIYIYSSQEQEKRLSENPQYEEFLTPHHKRKKLMKGENFATTYLPNENKKKPDEKPLENIFPFKQTPSGNLKVNSKQVAFQTSNVSVLVADPKNTSVNIETIDKMAKDRDKITKDFPINAIMNRGLTEANLGDLLLSNFGSMPQRKDYESSEYDGKQLSEILDPELNLHRLGYTGNESIPWDLITLPEKRNLYLELYLMISNFTNADCKIFIDQDEFNCHLIVLQCYSEVFRTYVAVKKVELPSEKCSAISFSFIYEWMITGEPSYTDMNRENVLDIFNAAKYLKINDLIEQCWAFMDNIKVFSEDTAFLLYSDAKNRNVPEVRELMLPRVQNFFLMLVSSQDWLDLDLEDVKAFLSSNYISVNCEMEVFMAGVRWLKHDWPHRDQYKVEVLSCVRFGNIAPWQLVDIKRNPDNPDFHEFSMHPEICRFIDDGLSFVIIKYWYGLENEEYQHWIGILALKEPLARNWSKNDKTYFTYREFLIYLDQYRRSHMADRTKAKERKRNIVCGNVNEMTPKQSHERLAPRMPTREEFLSTKMTGVGDQESD